MPRLDVGNVLVESGTGLIGGGIQRMAWESSQMVGLIATGAFLIGGVVIQAMVDQPLLQQVGKAATISGATVAGWVGSEKYLIGGVPRTPLIAAEQQRALLEAQARRRGQVGARSGVDGASARNAWAVIEDRDRTVL